MRKKVTLAYHEEQLSIILFLLSSTDVSLADNLGGLEEAVGALEQACCLGLAEGGSWGAHTSVEAFT